jgi:two-component system sensor histidine kinase CpxA
MRKLFVKIFLSFWLTVLLACVAIVALIAYSVGALGRERSALASSLLPAEAERAAEIFERSGEDALRAHLDDLERKQPVQAFFFSPEGHEILDRGPSTEIRQTAKALEGKDGLRLDWDRAGHRAAGPSRKAYSLVLLLHPGASFEKPTASRESILFPFVLPAIMLIAVTLFCYLITRHITTPLIQLGAAAGSIADGHLDTRVSPALKGRQDELADLGRDFDRMAERIESLVAGQRRLLGEASHELRSPLSRLMLALSLAKQGPAEEAPEHLERIALETRRLDKLIGQLLTLSRIDSGVPAGVRTSFDLTNLVQEVANDGNFEAQALARRVEVTAAEACTITGVEELLRSAVENVVRNAVRHTREGTSVEVSLQRRDGSSGPLAVLRVRDRGTGVPEAMLTEIFLPFRRVSTADEASPAGAGLGLAITARAVSAHAGKVRAMNAADGGLIVEIELPE